MSKERVERRLRKNTISLVGELSKTYNFTNFGEAS